MIVLDVVQGTEAWLRARLGMPTASQFGRILTPKTRKASSSAHGYLCQLVAERIIGLPMDDASTGFMQRGSALEAEAVAAYEFEHDLVTTKVGFVMDDSERWGCSPDRLVGEDGGLEIKCLSAPNHVAALLGGKDEEHILQVQGQLWVTGRRWWDVYFYSPAMPPHRVRLERDEALIAQLAESVEGFCQALDHAHSVIVGGAATVAATESMDAPAQVGAGL